MSPAGGGRGWNVPLWRACPEFISGGQGEEKPQLF